jgi:hypothetical protein
VLTIVSATAVLGSRLVLGGYRTPAAALLVLAAIEWAVLSGPVLRRWVTPTVGISFVAGVAADSVALLSAMLAVPYRTPWLGYVALALILVALGLYAFAS